VLCRANDLSSTLLCSLLCSCECVMAGATVTPGRRRKTRQQSTMPCHFPMPQQRHHSHRSHRRRSATTEHGTRPDPGQTGTPVPSLPMSRRELAVASHREREHTIGLAKPTYGTTAALPRAFAAGGHVTNRPCRAPCACMPPEAVALATVLAYPGHEPSRREPVVAGHRERKPAQPNNLKIQSIQPCTWHAFVR